MLVCVHWPRAFADQDQAARQTCLLPFFFFLNIDDMSELLVGVPPAAAACILASKPIVFLSHSHAVKGTADGVNFFTHLGSSNAMKTGTTFASMHSNWSSKDTHHRHMLQECVYVIIDPLKTYFLVVPLLSSIDRTHAHSDLIIVTMTCSTRTAGAITEQPNCHKSVCMFTCWRWCVEQYYFKSSAYTLTFSNPLDAIACERVGKRTVTGTWSVM